MTDAPTPWRVRRGVNKHILDVDGCHVAECLNSRIAARIVAAVNAAARYVAIEAENAALMAANAEMDTELNRMRDEIARLRAAFRVNMLRLSPGTTHDEIDTILEAVKHGGGECAECP